MKKINKILVTVVTLIIGVISVHQVIAATPYTTSDVAQHNTSSSCWAIYDNGVYDITTYLAIHNQRYYDITSWCGTDITTNFDNIAKHRGTAQTLLESFKIGILSTSTDSKSTTNTTSSDNTTNNTSTTQTDTPTTSIQAKNPYNFLLPLILGIVLYWGHHIIVFNRKTPNPKWIKAFNAFWNTLLVLTLLIPSFGFGIIMILQYQFPSLANSSFNFMYWHVELSVFMGVLAISHFIHRIRIYLIQIKK